MASFNSGTMQRVSLSSSCSSHKRQRLSSVKKTTAVLVRAMTDKKDKRKSGEWYETTKTRWQQPAGSSGGQSSLDAWEHVKPKGKWKEVSTEFEATDVFVKEKKITWNKSGNESSKREADLYTLVESAATDGKQEEWDRDKLSDRLEEFRKRKEEEDEAMCLIEEMRKTWSLHNTKVLRRSKGCAVLFENTSIVTKKIKVVRGH